MANQDPHDDRFREEGSKQQDPRSGRQRDDQRRFPPEEDYPQSYDPYQGQQTDRGDWRAAAGYGESSGRQAEPVFDRGESWRYGSADHRGGYRGERGPRRADRDDWQRYDLATRDRVWRDREAAGYAGSRHRPYEGRPEDFQGGGYQGYEGRSGLMGTRHYEDDFGRPSHRGRGPKNYRRSDKRIHEDVSDRLTDDRHVDASDIEVSVSDREVTLSGEVDSRQAKRHAEDCADSVAGVEHVQNDLRVKKTPAPGGNASGDGADDERR